MTSQQHAHTNANPGQEPQRVRRFAPQPIEHSTKKSSTSSRNESPEKRDAPKPRRFAPQVIEQGPKASRQNSSEPGQDARPKPRRFAPQPMETSQGSSKDREAKTGHVKFSPQPMETSFRSNRSDSEKKAPRKFAPVLIESAKRSRKSGDGIPSRPQDYRTEQGHLIHAREHRRHITGDRTPAEREDNSDEAVSPHHVEFALDMPRRPVSPLDGSAPARQTFHHERNHSFRCPDLDTIESSESERDSGPSSLAGSPAQGSPITASDSSFTDYYKHATRIRESVDENFAHYLLQLEAKKAQQRLREQALAAFPNSDFHEPVQHYVNDDNESDDIEYEDRVVTWEGFDEDELLTLVRRRDSTKVPWEQLEMQRHAERAEQERRAHGTNTHRESSRSPWWNPVHGLSVHDPDSEMRSMRDRARPPMLGRDLVFPRCPSPEPARFDVTQGSNILRKQLSNDSSTVESGSQKVERGLWNAAGTTTNSTKRSKHDDSGDNDAKKPKMGLWGGFCRRSESEEAKQKALSPPQGPTGLMTPQNEPSNPFEKSFYAAGLPPGSSLPKHLQGGLSSGGTCNGLLATPPTPPAEPRSAPDMAYIDSVLVTNYELEQEIESSYPDEFITQVFNYLSLGYPSLARPFDEELSKISRIEIKELRQDDVKARNNPRGYIRLPGGDFEDVVRATHGDDGDTSADDDADRAKREECVRWKALKLYIHEWARQEKNMVKTEPGSSAGPGAGQFGAVIERRGSWGI